MREQDKFHHPGELIAESLKEKGITANQLARELDIPSNRLYEIIRGRRSVTADTAYRLALHWGGKAKFWLDVQTAYDLACLMDEKGEEIKSRVRVAG